MFLLQPQSLSAYAQHFMMQAVCSATIFGLTGDEQASVTANWKTEWWTRVVTASTNAVAGETKGSGPTWERMCALVNDSAAHWVSEDKFATSTRCRRFGSKPTGTWLFTSGFDRKKLCAYTGRNLSFCQRF